MFNRLLNSVQNAVDYRVAYRYTLFLEKNAVRHFFCTVCSDCVQELYRHGWLKLLYKQLFRFDFYIQMKIFDYCFYCLFLE